MNPLVFLTIIFVTIATLWTVDRADTRATEVEQAKLLAEVLKCHPPQPRPPVATTPGGGVIQTL